MPVVRVFLLTCRRPALLRRALASLRAQTLSDWVCELHNDAPEDDTPRRILEELGDPRITLHHHERNWGPVAVFNHACAGCPEPFFSILEDDNWWEPALLARLLDLLQTRPAAELAWSNLRFWREEEDGSWTDLRRTLWPVSAAPVAEIATPQLIQFDGPLHSNGAMLARSAAAAAGRLQVPAAIPFSAMENLRERAFRGPLLLVPEPLANFAITRSTARGHDLGRWLGQQALMGAGFLRHAAPPPEAVARLWRSRRAAVPRATGGLLLAGLLARDRRFLSHAKPGDWLGLAAGFLRRPRATLAALRARRLQPALAAAFDHASRAFAAPAPATPGAIPAFALADPSDILLRIRSGAATGTLSESRPPELP